MSLSFLQRRNLMRIRHSSDEANRFFVILLSIVLCYSLFLGGGVHNKESARAWYLSFFVLLAVWGFSIYEWRSCKRSQSSSFEARKTLEESSRSVTFRGRVKALVCDPLRITAYIILVIFWFLVSWYQRVQIGQMY